MRSEVINRLTSLLFLPPHGICFGGPSPGHSAPVSPSSAAGAQEMGAREVSRDKGVSCSSPEDEREVRGSGGSVTRSRDDPRRGDIKPQVVQTGGAHDITVNTWGETAAL